MIMERQHRIWVRVLALGVAGGLVLAQLVQNVYSRLTHLAVLVVVSLFFSFAMEPAVARLSKRMRRGAATAIVLAGVVLSIVGLAAIGGAVIIQEGSRLVENLPSIAASLQARLHGLGINIDLVEQMAPGGTLDHLRQSSQGWISDLPQTAASAVGTFLVMLFMTFYFAADSHRLIKSACSLISPSRQQHIVRAWELAIEKAGGYLYSRVVLAGASAAVHALVFVALGVEYPIPMGIWVGVVSQVIPIVGTYLAGALPVIVELGVSTEKALAVLVVIVIYQQIENIGIAPRVTRNTMNIHPLAGFVSVLAGGALLGWVGALVAVPVTATAVAFISAFLPRHDVVLDAAGRTTGEDDPS
jgi:predicted PurR-regulated permease PerM